MKWVRRGLVVALAWRLFGPVLPPRWRKPQEHPWRVSAGLSLLGIASLQSGKPVPFPGHQWFWFMDWQVPRWLSGTRSLRSWRRDTA